MIWIGTSGFQYPEWKGKFYPETISAPKMLPFYAAQFPTTEINYSFYRIPAPKTLANWSEATPPEFRFSFKAPKQITHVLKLKDCDEIVNRFCETLQMMERKLGAILFQLPPFFKKDAELLQSFIARLPYGFHYAFEFRHPSWFDDEIFALLKNAKVALCIADAEKLSTPAIFTANFGYLRLRHEGYTPRDIQRWAEIIAEQKNALSDIYVYFKHEEGGIGPEFAKQLEKELEKISVHSG